MKSIILKRPTSVTCAAIKPIMLVDIMGYDIIPENRNLFA
jgi:hypothetical protein